MRLLLFPFVLLLFPYCGAKSKKDIQPIVKKASVSEFISRDKIRGVWLRSEYIDKLKKEKNPSESYLEYKDFIALRFFKYDITFSLSLWGGEIDSILLEKADAEYALEYKNNKNIYVEILDLHHDLENYLEANLYDSLTQFGYELRIKNDLCDYAPKDGYLQYAEFEDRKGFKCLEIKKDSAYVQEKYFLKFKDGEVKFTIHRDSVIEYTFVQVNRVLRMGNLGSSYRTIPKELYYFTVMGKYHIYNANNELLEESIVLDKNGKVRCWEKYVSYSVGLVNEKGLKNLIYLEPREPKEGEYSHQYIIEREGDIIKLYHATSQRFERFLQHKKGTLAFELRPSPNDKNIIPI